MTRSAEAAEARGAEGEARRPDVVERGGVGRGLVARLADDVALSGAGRLVDEAEGERRVRPRQGAGLALGVGREDDVDEPRRERIGGRPGCIASERNSAAL